MHSCSLACRRRHAECALPLLPPAAGACLRAILAAQRSVRFGRKCGHFREQAYEPLGMRLRLATKSAYGPSRSATASASR